MPVCRPRARVHPDTMIMVNRTAGWARRSSCGPRAVPAPARRSPLGAIHSWPRTLSSTVDAVHCSAMDHDADIALARVAQRQRGLFTLDDAQRCGIPARTVQRRSAGGLWVERQPRVYSAASAPHTVELAGRAALLSAGPTAMLSHLSAAVSWRLRRECPERPWLTVPYGRKVPRLWDIEVTRSRHLEGVRRLRDEVTVTSAARTIVDLGRVLDRNGVESALAVGLQMERTTMVQVEAALVPAWRTAGTGLVRDIVVRFSPGWESVLSARLARLAAQAGIGLVTGVVVRDATGRPVARPDFVPRGRRMAIEADGWAFHGSKAQQQADRLRDRRLLALGWTTVRFTTEDILRRPEQVIAELRSLLALRAA